MEQSNELISDTSLPPPPPPAEITDTDEKAPPADEKAPPVDEKAPPADEKAPPVDEKAPPADEVIINPDTFPLFYKDKGIGSAVILDEEDCIGSEEASVPGNFCHFSTINCSKFWAIFNSIQLFLCWIIVCTNHLPTLVGQDPHPNEEIGTKLLKCMEGGSPGAQSTRLALQIIFLLVYTSGSILFTIANFPPNQVLRLRSLFTKIFTWTFIAFMLVFVIPFVFHLPVGECYEFISLILWMILTFELGTCCVILYFSWRIVKLFEKYLTDSSENQLVRAGSTPPVTPVESEDDLKH